MSSTQHKLHVSVELTPSHKATSSFPHIPLGKEYKKKSGAVFILNSCFHATSGFPVIRRDGDTQRTICGCSMNDFSHFLFQTLDSFLDLTTLFFLASLLSSFYFVFVLFHYFIVNSFFLCLSPSPLHYFWLPYYLSSFLVSSLFVYLLFLIYVTLYFFICLHFPLFFASSFLSFFCFRFMNCRGHLTSRTVGGKMEHFVGLVTRER